MATGAAHRFEDAVSPVSAANLNSLDRGGNVYVSSVGGLKVDVSPVRGVINSGAVISYAGASQQSVTGSTTNYLYLDATGALVINTSGFPTYSSAKYYPLATVTTSSSGITAIADSRFSFWLP